MDKEVERGFLYLSLIVFFIKNWQYGSVWQVKFWNVAVYFILLLLILEIWATDDMTVKIVEEAEPKTKFDYISIKNWQYDSIWQMKFW